MVEYKVFSTEYMSSQALQIRLNALAKDGWHAVCDTKAGLVLERLVPPIIKEDDISATLSLDFLEKEENDVIGF